jgi:hypothetical protein
MIMPSIAACCRCLLLLILPFFILFSVLNFISPPLPPPIISEISSKHSLNQSSNPLLTSVSSTVTTTKFKTCHSYNVSDARPFFEQEPPQSNLPRRVSNSSRHNLLRRLRSLRLAVLTCARNAEKHVDKLRQHVEPIIDLFHPSSQIIILESDSTDNTLQKLKQWSRPQLYTDGKLSTTIPQRPERIAHCRNKLLEKARQLQADYMLVLDLDIFATNVSSFLTNFDYDTDDWSVMTANLVDLYYDIWALRTLSDAVLNYDVWHRVWRLASSGDYCRDSVINSTVTNHQKPFPVERDLLEVRSAFGGAALYKMNATKDCYYSGKPMTCEHVSFHTCIREKHQARIFINPKFTNEDAYRKT